MGMGSVNRMGNRRSLLDFALNAIARKVEQHSEETVDLERHFLRIQKIVRGGIAIKLDDSLE